jgi:type II secretory pathway pseudopilin PulG
LVVIAIIGVLVALLLPAIQSARESARRTSCANNLKQIGLALTEHVSTKQTFPPGQKITCTNCDPWAWSVMILPYMEQSEIFELINFNHAPNDQTFSANLNTTNLGWSVSTRLISTYLCPSTAGAMDPSRSDENRLNNYYGQTATKAGLNMACSDYAGIEGPNNGVANPVTGKLYATNQGILLKVVGSATISQVIKPREIPDGMSRTMVVGEMAGRGFNAKSSHLKISGTWSDGFNTANVNLAFSGPPSGTLASSIGMLPNSTVYANWCPAFASDELISYHSGGGYILMCDNSVQFVTPDIDQVILRSLASRNGGETISIDLDGD